METRLKVIGNASPIIKKRILFAFTFEPLTSSKTVGDEPIISPANKQVIEKGIKFKSSLIVKKPPKKPMIAPIMIGIRNRIQDLKALNKLLIAFINLSYNLKRIAIVEPLIPGTITAIPMNSPNTADLNQLFGVYFSNFASSLLLIIVLQLYT